MKLLILYKINLDQTIETLSGKVTSI